MSREKDLVKNTFILSIGKFLPKLASFVTLPILTAYLTKDEYGNYDLISTLIMLVLPVATLQIQSAAFRFLIDCRGDKEKSTQIISNIFLVTLAVSLPISIIIQFFFMKYSVATRIAISVYFFLDTIHLTVGQAVRGLGHNKAYSVGSIILSTVNMICIVIFVYKMRLGLLGVILSLAVAQFIGTAYLIIKVRLNKYISFSQKSFGQIKEMIAYSWPMIPNNLSNWALKLSDRLVITGFLGAEANAVYAVANKIPSMLSIAQSVMVMAWQENASIAVKDKDSSEYYTKMLNSVFNLMFGCTAMLIAATPIMFKILIKGSYAEAYDQMPVLILGMFFYAMSSYFGGIYIAHKKTMNVGITTMIAAAINLTIDLCCVHFIGIWAGSISTLVAYAVLYVYRMFNCQKFQPMKVNYIKQVIMIAMLVGMLVMCIMQNTVLNVINIALAVVLFVVFNKDVILGTINKKVRGKSKK